MIVNLARNIAPFQNCIYGESRVPTLIIYEVARGPVPVAKLESLESRLDHVSERKGLNLT